MKVNLSLLAIVMSLFLFSSCNDTGKNGQKHEAIGEKTAVQQKTPKKDCKDVHWSHHKGEEGPENWKNLCEGFKDCGGNAQSPIDIETSSVIKSDDLKAPGFHYGKTKVDIINNGHTVQFNVDGNNTVNLNGKDYKLLQFHYHALSEHTIDKQHFPLEVHFVHKHSDKDYAVIGIMFKEGKENALFQKYLDKFPVKKGEFKSDDMIDLYKLMPANKSYYYYDGSLTTPPCTEIVSWYVFKNPVEASKAQIDQFSKILDHNYRPVQPLNGRKVKLFEK